jgi:hypothetical protein
MIQQRKLTQHMSTVTSIPPTLSSTLTARGKEGNEEGEVAS